MNLFSISDLERFSGIKAHTIRMWEQRYGALKPHRSEGNTRYYDGTHLRRLLNIVSLTGTGMKVSEICRMPDEKLQELLLARLNNPGTDSSSREYFITQILAAAMAFDEVHFDKLFASALLRFELKETYTTVIYPVLVRLGLMWAGDALRPAHEHFITGLIRQKLLAAIDALPPPATGKDTWLLFLPEDEFHETGLLMACFLIRHAGGKVIYLGANVPAQSLVEAAKATHPDRLLLFLVSKNMPTQDEELIRQLHNFFPGKFIFVACNHGRLTHIQQSRFVKFLHSVQELENQLK